MLGTLAVMGVLTIGGIAGFNYAMNKQRANATVGYVNELAVLGTGQMLAGGTPKLLDYPKQTPSGYPADITTEDGKDNLFYIEISEVPAAVCDEIISRLDGWKMVNDIGFISVGEENIGACSDKEKVGMWFEITANANKGDTDYHCETDADCAGWANAVGVCNAKGICEIKCQTGYIQTASGCCKSNKVFNGGCCSGTINTDENGDKVCCITVAENSRCCKAGEFWAENVDGGKCLSCDDPRTVYTYYRGGSLRTGVCNACPKRHLEGWYCKPENQDCPEGQDLKNGYCYCPLNKPVQNNKGQCFSCNATAGWPPMMIQAPLELKKYGNSALSFYCNRPTGAGYAGYKQCESGSIGLPVKYTITLADGSSYQVSNSYGECKSCDEVATSELKYQAWCESCGGKWVGKAWDKGTCHTP